MAGGGSATEAKIEINTNNNECPSSASEITDIPSSFFNVTKTTSSSPTKLDISAQALKALSFRSPFVSEEPQASPASVSGANSLPVVLVHLLSRHSDRRKRQKLNFGAEKKSGDQVPPHGGHIWTETEEYFRDLTVKDVERLDQVSCAEFSGNEKFFMIPCLGDDDDDACDRYNSLNRLLAMTCENERLNMTNGTEMKSPEEDMTKEVFVIADDISSSADVEYNDREMDELLVEEGENGEDRKNNKLSSVSGVEWLLGTKTRIYSAPERPSRKRKELSRDASLEKLLVARSIAGIDSVCHYCSYDNTGDPLNYLIKCDSCGMLVHRKCYGVNVDISSAWLCSWCKWKNSVGLSTNRPCFLCPKQGGALKPVKKRCADGGGEESDLEFAHLFCCQWMPEAYVENTLTMEPIIILNELKDKRMKLFCNLCKVKYGACIKCTKGACRVLFHPICAREAGYRMEIWGKLGSVEVELHAFCFRHSEIQHDGTSQSAGDISCGETADMELLKLNDIPLDIENILGREVVDRNENEGLSSCSDFNFTLILKKLIDLGKVDAKGLACEIGISHNTLSRILSDNHMAPELHCKLVQWLKKHAHIGSLQNTLKTKTSLLVTTKYEDVPEGASPVSAEPDIPDVVPVKSIPPRRRTKGNIRIVKDDDSSVGKICGETAEILVDSAQHQVNSASDSPRIEDEVTRVITQCHFDDGVAGETKPSEEMSSLPLLPIDGESAPNSYVHPFIYSRLILKNNDVLEMTTSCESPGSRDREVSQLGASSSSGLCCRDHVLRATSGDCISECNGENLDQLAKARIVCKLLKLSPKDELEGELIYYQHRLLCNAVTRKHTSDDLRMKVIKNLPQEIGTASERKWDTVLVSQYNHELREIKKQGRKERRHKEAQAILAAATAAAASSSRVSSFRKDALEESIHQENSVRMNVSDVRSRVFSQLNPRVKEAAASPPVTRTSLDTKSESFQLTSDISRQLSRTCDVCWHNEADLNPVLVCSSCKVTVHVDCYRSVRSSTGPWYCELCEDLFSSQGFGTSASNSLEKPALVAECGLCGGTAGAFRKSVNEQWIHALCAEWVLETTYRRGQVNPIQGMETVNKGVDTCVVCHRNQGVCLKCSYGHCQSAFHPTCARSAGFYMTVQTSNGKLQHKSYCGKHSLEQRAKCNTQRHGIEELKSLKQVRVELERLRLLCERIIKREKLKRELVICSHDVLASSRDSVLSTLARHPFYQPDASSESATTSIQGYTDGYKSSSENVQRSDDITIDSTVAGKRRVKISLARESNQKSAKSSTSQSLYMLKPVERIQISGKQIPQRLSIASRNISDNLENHSKYNKQTETFEKELVMTSDQASIKNQRLPKGFVYVPVQCISKGKETNPDECS